MENRTPYCTRRPSILPDAPKYPPITPNVAYRTALHALIRHALRQGKNPQQLYHQDPEPARAALIANNPHVTSDQADAIIMNYLNRTWPELQRQLTPDTRRRLQLCDPVRNVTGPGAREAYYIVTDALLSFWDAATEASLQ